jgi:hypothetical protein
MKNPLGWCRKHPAHPLKGGSIALGSEVPQGAGSGSGAGDALRGAGGAQRHVGRLDGDGAQSKREKTNGSFGAGSDEGVCGRHAGFVLTPRADDGDTAADLIDVPKALAAFAHPRPN